jgi:hypothetical protein
MPASITAEPRRGEGRTAEKPNRRFMKNSRRPIARADAEAA